MDAFDYVIVGGGSAGCTITARLVQAGKRVALIESGPPDNHPFIHIPATFFKVHGTNRMWMYKTARQGNVNDREMYIPQGRTLGGGSSVNAMIYIRGQHEDFDDWEALGARGWGWRDVLPFFVKSEGNARLKGPLHGTSGPLKVNDARHVHPFTRAFVEAAVQAGVPLTDDFNGERQEGAGLFQTTTFDGRRGSSAATYLRMVKHDARLRLVTGADVLKVLCEGRRATGVLVRHANGETEQLMCREEVIVCAGGAASPRLLMHSGIGPAAHLREFGIPVVHDLRGVGENFQDHLTAPVYGRARHPHSVLGHDRGYRALRHGLQYVLTRSGLLSSNVIESGAFIDTSGSGRPDIQIHTTPTLVGDVDRKPLEGHGITIGPCVVRPKSRGTVRLVSKDPLAPARLDPRFFSHPDDMETMIRGVRISRKILRAPALREVIAEELLPGAADEISDARIEEHVRTVCKTVFHPAGSCRMGTDELAVVDPHLRVHGVSGLRVADASVMPALVSGNTNATAIMIGERCADFILNAPRIEPAVHAADVLAASAKMRDDVM
ncbi:MULTISPECIES: GMC family oxidoreductase N-terminal domain-containing protein [unclassified Caballeronia]|uniref:GMC family oxidoreductase n=1 Tax=unclassified Caballeronia TaxID=2646786 RepID=UPI00285B9E15|nr:MULTISPECIES: GMC family oxidoreductase N-terminal domain-containing protein [unclassified Caballeronia]MDR5822235.1 GMC family oxidoreductase N-terminal domain-containing protein [Caballeronia sp. LZ043]MDR5880391.1 GMC family oxidoreductase N-terminal domain-containing protein [Caballeronia sp. LZ032]